MLSDVTLDYGIQGNHLGSEDNKETLQPTIKFGGKYSNHVSIGPLTLMLNDWLNHRHVRLPSRKYYIPAVEKIFRKFEGFQRNRPNPSGIHMSQ